MRRGSFHSLDQMIVKDSVGVKINQTLSILCGALRELLVLSKMDLQVPQRAGFNARDRIKVRNILCR